MSQLLAAEWIKYRRSFTRRLALFAPAFFVLLALAQHVVAPGLSRGWDLLLMIVANQWSVLFVPLGAALLAGLAAAQEQRTGAWRSLRVRPVPPGSLYATKAIVLALHAGLSSLAFLAMVLIAGALTATGPIPWPQLLLTALLPWLTALPLLAIQLWIAAAFGTGASIALGMVGFVGGIVAAPTRFWLYLPWSWPTRLLSPVIGIHPNGVPLQPGDPLLNPVVLPIGLALVVLTAPLITLAGGWWFTRREVR